MSDALTADDLRWAEGEALEQVADLRSDLEMTRAHRTEARERITDAMVIWSVRAARFRAAAEAMEREGKRDGDRCEKVE